MAVKFEASKLALKLEIVEDWNSFSDNDVK